MELFSLTINTTITDVQWQAYPIGFFLLLLCLLTILGNLLVLYAIIREKTLHISTYYYIASLAFADLLVGLIAMPFAFIFEMTDDEYWLFRRHLRFLCDFWHSMDIFASAASIFGLCAIGLDRYISITKPMLYPNSFISKRWYYMLSIIWIGSAMISFPAVIYFGTAQTTNRRLSMSNGTVVTQLSLFKECDFPNNTYYMLFVSVVSFYVPLSIMMYVYVQVYIAAKKQVLALRSGYKHHYRIKSAKSFIPKFRLKEISNKNDTYIKNVDETNENDVHLTTDMLVENRRPSPDLITLRIHHGKYQNPILDSFDQNDKNGNKSYKKMRRKRAQTNTFWKKFSRDQKAAKFIGIIMGVFVVCWLPYFVYFLLSGVFKIRLKDENYHELLFKIFSWLGYTNSALDVLVYVFTSKELRTTFWKLFIPRTCRRKNGTN
ncbi:unnamed protein product [Adineta steineri]|uniref:G-protein coupled receptors family 1 profile domain-containing protein n=1 Tax=Adineta steineri TaxID=433720 RepID=A0A818FN89_9BILA|nr:unnamed protein product [Adineta steineri]CAF1045446.1 unnamed protein product [Adineta steineri]CAF3478424.1 unnamed protein product [Adineta steineri]CAF3995833.1 unnamed protein product [Adineta steineri]